MFCGMISLDEPEETMIEDVAEIPDDFFDNWNTAAEPEDDDNIKGVVVSTGTFVHEAQETESGEDYMVYMAADVKLPWKNIPMKKER